MYIYVTYAYYVDINYVYPYAHYAMFTCPLPTQCGNYARFRVLFLDQAVNPCPGTLVAHVAGQTRSGPCDVPLGH